MTIYLRFILLLVAVAAPSCKPVTNTSKSLGIASILQGKKEVYFPSSQSTDQWTIDIPSELKATYENKKFLVGGRIGEGAFGKVYHIKDAEGKVDENFVVKIFRYSYDHACEPELAFHNHLLENGVDTTGGAIGRVQRQKEEFSHRIVFKRKIKGKPMSDVMHKIKKGKELYRPFIEFKQRLAQGMLNLSKRSDPLYLVDIGETHHNNIMYDANQKKFLVVDGGLIPMNRLRAYISDMWSEIPQGRSFLNFGKLILHQLDQKLTLTREQFEVTIEKGLFKSIDLGEDSVGSACRIFHR